jgi:uncharacterized protein YneF (UPF0154 family)
MLALSTRHQFTIGFLLIALMIVTRGHHFATLNHLPSASWAVFFLAGFYISSKWMFPSLLGLAAFLDFAAINFSGVSSYCVSPAYGMLIPAYGTLWLAGRWYAGQYQFNVKQLFILAITIIIAAAITTLFSGGGFYFLSGRYTEPTLSEYAQRFITYYPRSLTNLAFYIGIVAAIHSYVSLVLGSNKVSSSSHS